MPRLTFTFFPLADLLEDLDNLLFCHGLLIHLEFQFWYFPLFYIFKIQNVSLTEMCC